MDEPSGHELTIDQLAQRTGMTVRNIRAHQSRELLPPPEVRARTGYYGPEHVARLQLIRDLQTEGFNLKSIERLLARMNGAGVPMLDFGRAALSSFAQEEPEVATLTELEARLHGPFDEKTLRRAEKIGFLRPLGADRYEIPSPTLMRAAEELVALGVPLHHAVAVGEQIERHVRAIAETFVRLFVQDVLGSESERATRSPQEWARLRASLDRLTPLATDAVHASFAQTMTGVVERQLEKSLKR